LKLSPGTSLGPYRILAPLGFGGTTTTFGNDLGCRNDKTEPSVYLAENKVLDRQVALKVLRTSCRGHDICRQRLQREARVLAWLDHPNIPAVFDLHAPGGVPLMAMQPVEGGTLRMLEHRAGCLQPCDALAVLRGVASALDYLHAKGLEHRNISPDNILIEGEVSNAPERARAYVADFCCVRIFGGRQPGAQLDPSSDLYSFALVTYEMLTGRLPFDAETTGSPSEGPPNLMMLYRLTHEDAPSPRAFNPSLPAVYDAIFARALSRDREERPRSAQAFVQDLTSGLAASLH
jgi:serine/threonine protein kinase